MCCLLPTSNLLTLNPVLLNLNLPIVSFPLLSPFCPNVYRRGIVVIAFRMDGHLVKIPFHPLFNIKSRPLCKIMKNIVNYFTNVSFPSFCQLDPTLCMIDPLINGMIDCFHFKGFDVGFAQFHVMIILNTLPVSFFRPRKKVFGGKIAMTQERLS